LRCPRCGNENSAENRFCGMCGAKLLGAPAVVASTPVAVAASSGESAGSRLGTSPAAPAPVPARSQVVAPPRSAAPAFEDSPGISGPSFLGLNDPPRKRGGMGADAQSSSSNLDYLLEDEEPKRGGAGKFALILLMLALAGGFGYFRWKWLVGTSKRPAVTTQAPDPSATTYEVPSSGSPTGTSTPPAPTPTQPAAPAAQPAPDSSSGNKLAAASPAAIPDAADTSSAKPDAPAPSDASSPSPDSSTNQPAAKEPDTEPAAAMPDAPPPPAPKPKKVAAEPQPKPPAGITPTRSADAVAEAQKYIYGRGVTQDCDRGMRLLKPAAAQANPKAMIEMGALYSAGLCTPHDLPTAYRWFAMALRKDPDNQAVQADLQKLWGEMTQPERQLAIRLSR
jgi:hypothetical protein